MNTNALRQKILDLAIHGKLVKQDPADEPASVMLEKLRAEKEAKIAAGEIKRNKNDSYIFKYTGTSGESTTDDNPEGLEHNRHYEKFADGRVKDIEDEIPFAVPEGWAWCRLGEICEISSSKRVLQKDWKKSGIPFYRAREITQLSNNEKVIEDLFITPELYKEIKQKYGVPEVGDLLVSAVGTIGKIYIVNESDCFYYKDASVICFSKKFKSMNSTYLKLCCESSFIQKQMYSLSKGTTVDTITINKAQKYLFPLPPIAEQKRIVTAIEAIFTQIELLEQNKADLQTAIKQAKSKILDLAIRGKLVKQDPADEPTSVMLEKLRAEKETKIAAGEIKRGKHNSYIYKNPTDNCYYEKFDGERVKDVEDEIPFSVPEGWAWCKTKQLYNIRSAIRIHQTDWQNEGIPFFRGRELIELCKTGKVHPEIFISESLYEENKEKGGVPQKNDLLVSAVGTLGFVHIVEGTKKFYYKDAYILCFENHFNLNPKYTKFVIESNYTQKVIYNGSKGTTVEQLTIENAKDLWFPLPPLAEQKRIVAKIEEIFNVLDTIQTNLI